MPAACMMVQGTTSDAGKSILVAGLCRLLARRGVQVTPFKPQNMALNSAVTVDGGEIGRAQALQAIAAGLEPHTDMNPILIKPSSDTQAQIIIHGRAALNLNASDYHDYKRQAKTAVLESYQRLNEQYDVVVVEGAGSPAEINLRDNDIANMGFAEAVDCPVIIIADIDRGGVFAHLAGTLQLLSPSEQQRVVGFVINRFRGDIKLLEPGLDWLEEYTHKPVLGVIPYLQNFYLDAEDAIASEQVEEQCAKQLNVVVPVYPRISNHTDFDALRAHPGVNLVMVRPGDVLPAADLIVLPGSKNVRRDLQHLREYGWDKQIQAHLRYGGKLLGICGGYQMLGSVIHDPNGVEDKAGSIEGLGYLPMQTELRADKQLHRVQGHLKIDNAFFKGYEIHCGDSVGAAIDQPLLQIEDGRTDGAISDDQQIIGTYVHGIFDEVTAADALLAWAGLQQPGAIDLNEYRQQQLDRLADCLEESLSSEFVDRLINCNNRKRA